MAERFGKRVYTDERAPLDLVALSKSSMGILALMIRERLIIKHSTDRDVIIKKRDNVRRLRIIRGDIKRLLGSNFKVLIGELS